jgi:poly(A) polymerase
MRTIRLSGNPFLASEAGRAAASVIARLRSAGFEAWLAGGCVRDAVLGEEAHDFDIATSAVPDSVRPLFPRVVDTGPKFGTVTVLLDSNPIQVTTFRKESEYLDGRRPTSLVFGVSLEDDAARRDFTINALYGDPVEATVVDMVGGLEDLAAKRIRAVGNAGDRFDEDALRMLRGVRFTARFGGSLDPETESAARARPHLLRKLSSERVGEELTKMLLGNNPGAAFRWLWNLGFLAEILPELDATAGVPQPPKFHPEGDVFFHTVDVLERLERRTLVLALAAIFHDVGKARTLTWTDRIRFHGHEPVSSVLADHRLRELRFSNDVIDQVRDLVDEHIRFGTFLLWRRAKQLRFVQKPNIHDHLVLHRADRESQGGDLAVYERAHEELRLLGERKDTVAPLLGGKDLIAMGLKPGPRIREILEAVRDAQLEGSLTSRDEALEHVRRQYFPPAKGDSPL